MDISPSASHSMGWEMQDARHMKLCTPDYTGAPPTKLECQSFKKAIERVARFYTEGEDKQKVYQNEVKVERQHFKNIEERLNEQLADLQRFSADHPRRKMLESELQSQLHRTRIEIRAREAAADKLSLLYKKREELASTLRYLGTLHDQHCRGLEKQQAV